MSTLLLHVYFFYNSSRKDNSVDCIQEKSIMLEKAMIQWPCAVNILHFSCACHRRFCPISAASICFQWKAEVGTSTVAWLFPVDESVKVQFSNDNVLKISSYSCLPALPSLFSTSLLSSETAVFIACHTEATMTAAALRDEWKRASNVLLAEAASHRDTAERALMRGKQKSNLVTITCCVYVLLIIY